MKSIVSGIVALLMFTTIGMTGCIDRKNGGSDGGTSDGSMGETPPPVLTVLTIAPASPTVSRGATQQFTATVTYADSSTADITSSVTWTSSDPSIATIDSAGLATSVAAGSTTIMATSGKSTASATLRVRDLALESPFGILPAAVNKSGYANNGYGDAEDIGVQWTRQGQIALWAVVQPDLNDPKYVSLSMTNSGAWFPRI